MFRKKTSRKSVTETLVGQLKTKAEDWGPKTGLYKLDDQFFGFARAEIRYSLAEQSPGQNAAALFDQIQTIRGFQSEFSQKLEAIESKRQATDRRSLATDRPDAAPHFNWKAAASVAFGCALTALLFDLSPKNWLIAGIIAAITILHLDTIPAWVRRAATGLRDYVDYRRALSGYARCERRIRRLQNLVPISKEQEYSLERSAQLAEQVVKSYFDMHKALGERAAQKISQP